MSYSSSAHAQLSAKMAQMGKRIGIGTVVWGVVFWFIGAILIALGAEVTHHTGHSGLINSTGFNLLFILGCGIAGFVVQSWMSWNSRKTEIRRLLVAVQREGGKGGYRGGAAAAAGGTVIGLAAGAGATGLVVLWVVIWVTSIMLMPLILAFTFFVFLY
jgi:hypothetical protein